MRIGILSDTHDLLRPEVKKALQGCDCILHAGDICTKIILDQLNDIAPTFAVRGNNDKNSILPVIQDLTFGGIRICMAHKTKDLPEVLECYHLAVTGHTHKYAEKRTRHKDGTETVILNPGSCGPRRFHQPITLAMVSADRDGITAIHQINIPHHRNESKYETQDIRRQIDIVIREMEKGSMPEDIARKYGTDPAAAKQIARLYVIHPGVTPDDIMEKMGI